MLQNPEVNSLPLINIKNKCMPEKVDLPAVLDAVNHQANQLAHSGTASRGNNLSSIPNNVMSTSSGGAQYGDSETFPIVFVTNLGDILLAMSVDGITCAHCVKIVETVLKGCNGNKSPIDGLLDAAADRDLCSVLVKIENISVAKRVAFEAARNLAMEGYTAKAKVISVFADQDGQKKLPEFAIVKAFDAVARTDPQTLFDWKVPCSCPDNGVLRSDCSRHSQMSPAIFEAFENRGLLTRRYLAGMSIDTISSNNVQDQDLQLLAAHQPQQLMNDPFQSQSIMQGGGSLGMNGSLSGNLGLDLFGGPSLVGNLNMGTSNGLHESDFPNPRAQRNPSIISFGGRAMSFGEASYGRAMSGLSALSIDWENMDDFDINVDHSAHINNGLSPSLPLVGGLDPSLDPKPIGGVGNARRSSFRQFVVGGSGDNDAHVSFK